ncbi:MAG: hypothetical protein AAF942_10625 [Pseudomonadota bacterium]
MMSTKHRLAVLALGGALTAALAGIPAAVGASGGIPAAPIAAASIAASVASPAAAPAAAPAASEDNPRLTLCKVLRENALTALRQEEIAFGAQYDADASISGAPSYELQQAHLALMKEIADEKEAVHERYRECVEKATPKG